MAKFPVFTIGHSTRTIEEFVSLLRLAAVQRVVDVRTIPRSRTNPHYNLDALPETLASYQISHTIIPELGGRRSRQKAVDPKINAHWQNQSFHNYADHALSHDFDVGLQRLLALADQERCAIMCSEAVWWRCHRRIISDYLLLHGKEVFHLMGKDRVEPAKLTEGAVAVANSLTYPAQA